MKKLIAISAAALMILSISALAYADAISTTKALKISLGVSDAFGFEVWDDDLDQILDNIDPGGTALADIHIYATSNHSVEWHMSAKTDGLVGQTQATPDTLPVMISTFDGAGVGLTGTMVEKLLLTGSDQTIYTAGVGEYPIKGLQVSGLAIIESPVATQQDWYEGYITLTMSE